MRYRFDNASPEPDSLLGGWVKYEDYERALARIAELEAVASRLVDWYSSFQKTSGTDISFYLLGRLSSIVADAQAANTPDQPEQAKG